ncbi:MAG: PTS sugar transporter subunit IIB [Oscillospiraceae bacterium]|nr:PTS sugar transporter subunit IIB [Oscillospiraceae bacterium]
MKTTMVRIDDRLIHGQVVVGWTRTAGVTCILVVDDKTAKDKVQCSLLRMATPVGIKAEFLTIDDAAEKIKADAYKNESLMILVRGPKAIIGLMDRGVEITSLNIGNLRSAPGKVKLLSHVYSMPEEVEEWKELDRRNVKMSAQILPDQIKTDFNEVLRKL